MRIALYCPNKPLGHPNPSGDLVIAQGIQQALRRLGHPCEEAAAFRARWFWRSREGWAAALAGLHSAVTWARRFKPHVWLTYHTYYKTPDVLGPWVSRLLGCPYVLFQPMYATRRRREPGTRMGFYLNRRAIRAARHAFTNNLDDLAALRRALPAQRITYLPPGIFPEEFERDPEAGNRVRARHGLPPETPLLMAAARFRADVKFESLTYLFHALAILQRRPPDFRLLLAGDGPMEGELRTRAEGLLPGRVVFAGKVERERMRDVYSAADLFVFPGIGESLGMVFLEAQACGLPVVALHTAGVPQVVRNGETGLLVPEDGGQAMAEALEALIGDDALRRRLAAGGPCFVRRERNLHRNYLQLEATLQRIVQQGR